MRLQDLVDSTGSAGQYARDVLANAPKVGETPRDTSARQMHESIAAGRQNLRDNAAMEARGIPTQAGADGTFSAITDDTGAPLRDFDKKSGNAWTSLGTAVNVKRDKFNGSPAVVTPAYDAAPAETDPKTGNIYKKPKGLPWQYQGQDAGIVADNSQRAKDKDIAAMARATGAKVSIDAAERVSATHDFKGAQKAFGAVAKRNGLNQEEGFGASIASAIDDGDLPTARAAIDGHFDTLYAAREANAKAGFLGMGKNFTPEAIAIRAALDADKAEAHTHARRMIEFQTRGQGAQAREDRDRAQHAALQRQHVESLYRETGLAMPDDAAQSAPATGAATTSRSEAGDGSRVSDIEAAPATHTLPQVSQSARQESAKLPTAGSTPASASLQPETPNSQPAVAPEGFWGTVGREFATKIAPAVATAGGGVAAGALAIPSGPGAIAADIAAGAASGTAAHALQKHLMGDKWSRENEEQLQANAAAHPTASMLGSTIPFLISLLGGGGVGSKVLAAGKSLGKTATQAGEVALRDAAAAGIKYRAPLIERVAAAGALGARGGASEGAQEKYVEGKDVSVLDRAARGAATFAVTGILPGAKELGALGLFALSKELLTQATKRGVADGVAMTFAGQIYDAAFHGKPMTFEGLKDEAGGAIPAFIAQNLVLGALHTAHGQMQLRRPPPIDPDAAPPSSEAPPVEPIAPASPPITDHIEKSGATDIRPWSDETGDYVSFTVPGTRRNATVHADSDAADVDHVIAGHQRLAAAAAADQEASRIKAKTEKEELPPPPPPDKEPEEPTPHGTRNPQTPAGMTNLGDAFDAAGVTTPEPAPSAEKQETPVPEEATAEAPSAPAPAETTPISEAPATPATSVEVKQPASGASEPLSAESLPTEPPAAASAETGAAAAPERVGNKSAIPTTEESARWDALSAHQKPIVESLSDEKLDGLAVKIGVKRSGVSDAVLRDKILNNTHPDDLQDALEAAPVEKPKVPPLKPRETPSASPDATRPTPPEPSQKVADSVADESGRKPPLPGGDKPAPKPSKAAKIHSVEPAQNFAASVKAAAKTVPQDGRFGTRKVFINRVHEAWQTETGQTMPLADFKTHILAELRDGNLGLTRSDLPQSFTPKQKADHAASALRDGSDEFHFMTVDADSAPAKKAVKPLTAKEAPKAEKPVEPAVVAPAIVEPEAKTTEKQTSDAEYEAALESSKAASKAFLEIQRQYRAKEIDDAAFFEGRKAFNASERAFDAAEAKLIAAKKTEASLSPDSKSLSDTAPSKALPINAVRNIVAGLLKKFPGSAETIVVQDGSDLPAEAISEAKERGISLNRIGGIHTSDGRVFINANGMRGISHVASVFFHENLAHHAIDKILDGIEPGSAKKLEAILRSAFKTESEFVDARYQPHEFVSEVLAKLSERTDLNAKQQGAWGRIVDYIRTVMAKTGFKNWQKADIEALIRRGTDRIRNGKPDGEPTGNGPKFSLSDEAKKHDSDYMDAVKRGDVKEQQRHVDAAANEANYDIYTPLVHHTFKDFTEFKAGGGKKPFSDAGWSGNAIWLEPETLHKGRAEGQHPPIAHTRQYEAKKNGWTRDESFANMKSMRLYARLIRPMGGTRQAWREELIPEHGLGKEFPLIVKDSDLVIMQQLGRDSAYITDENGNIKEVIVFKPEQLKSADPVTRNSKGKVIPLSERFNESKKDIRFQLNDEAPEADTRRVTSIKNAVVDQQRKDRGELPLMSEAAKSMPEHWSEAMALIDKNPDYAGDMVDRILSGKKTEINAVDQQALLHEQIRVRNDRDLQADRAVDANLSQDDRDMASIRFSELERRVNDIDQSTKVAGTIAGRALQIRQQMMRDDYSPDALERKARVAKKGPLTEAELARVKADAKRYADADSAVKMHAQKAEFDRILKETEDRHSSEREAERAANYIHPDVLENAKQLKAIVGKRGNHGRSVFEEIYAEGATSFSHDDPGAASRAAGPAAERTHLALSEIAAEKLFDRNLTPKELGAEIAKEMKAKYGDRFRERSDSEWQDVWDGGNKILRDTKLAQPTKSTPSTTKTPDELKLAALEKQRDTLVDRLNTDQTGGKSKEHTADTLAVHDIKEQIHALKLAMDQRQEEKSPTQPKVKAVVTKAGLVEAMQEHTSLGGKVTDLASYIKRLGDVFFAEGTRDGEKLLDRIHDAVKEVDPKIDKETVRDLWTDYGQYKEASTDADKMRKAEIRGEQQKLAGIRDLTAGKQNLKTGREMHTPSALERDLTKERNKLLKAGKYVVTDPARALKSAQDVIQTRLRNKLADLRLAMESGVPMADRKSATTYDTKSKAMQAEYEAKKAEYDAMFPKDKDASDKAAIERGLDKSIADIKAELASGKLYADPKGPALTNTQIEAKRAELEALRDERQTLRSLDTARVEADRIKVLEKRKAEAQAKLDAGDTSLKPAVKGIQTPATIALEAEIKAITDEHNALRRNDENRWLQQRKASLSRQIADILDRDARGDFAQRVKREHAPDPEAQWLEFERHQAKGQFETHRQEWIRANWTPAQKAAGAVGDVFHTMRALMTGGELSGVLRQGKLGALSHPLITFGDSVPAMLRAFRSEGGEHAVMQEILNRPNAPAYVRAKLNLTDPGDFRAAQLEGNYRSRWANKIPLIAGSGRAYTMFLNNLRAGVFDVLHEKLTRRRGQLTLDQEKQIAVYVNEMTGSGVLGRRSQQAAEFLNVGFFAPKYVMSRFQMLTGHAAWRGDAHTRRLIAEEYGKILLGVGVMYGLYSLTKDSKEKIETDPRSSSFGKIPNGNHGYLDPMAGLIQATVLLARLTNGHVKDSKGNIIPIRQNAAEKAKFGRDNAFDVLAKFGRSKASPIAGAIIDNLNGTDFMGKPLTIKGQLINLSTPMTYGEIYNAMRAQGAAKGTALSMLAFFGEGVNTFSNPLASKPKATASGWGGGSSKKGWGG